MTNIALVNLEQGIFGIGFRKIAAIVRLAYPEATIVLVPTGNLYSVKSGAQGHRDLSGTNTDTIATFLSSFDIILFSFMSVAAQEAQDIADKIKQLSPLAYLCAGGAHATLQTEEAKLHFDSVCVGEGENVILNIITQRPVGIINGPLLSSDELSQQPFAYNGYDCLIYEGQSLQPFTVNHYLQYNGLLFRTLWVRGCPYQCTYCANSALIRINQQYQKLRYASIDYIIAETLDALKTYHFTTTVSFDDDNFSALPLATIQQFVESYQKNIRLPYIIMGFHPLTVRLEKVILLAESGMKKLRMGIQSANPKTLALYGRNITIDKLKEAAEILIDTAKRYKIVPPFFDIISDCPVESEQDVYNTILFLNNLKRPFHLTIFSLRVMSGTQLESVLGAQEYDSSYLDTRPTLANVLLYLIPVFRIPTIFLWNIEPILFREYPKIHRIAKTLFLLHRQWIHLKYHDFSKIVGTKMWLFRRKEVC